MGDQPLELGLPLPGAGVLLGGAHEVEPGADQSHRQAPDGREKRSKATVLGVHFHFLFFCRDPNLFRKPSEPQGKQPLVFEKKDG